MQCWVCILVNALDACGETAFDLGEVPLSYSSPLISESQPSSQAIRTIMGVVSRPKLTLSNIDVAIARRPPESPRNSILQPQRRTLGVVLVHRHSIVRTSWRDKESRICLQME